MAVSSNSLLKWSKPQVILGLAGVNANERLYYRAAQDIVSSNACGGVVDPVLVDLIQQTCREAATNQIDKEQILNAIIPIREWTEDKKSYRQELSRQHAGRAEVRALMKQLDEQLRVRQARPYGICTIRRELSDQIFDEIIRQVTIDQPERGLLLLRVRDELRMTMAAYRDLVLNAREHDPRQSVGKDTVILTEEFGARVKELAPISKKVEDEKQQLLRKLENMDQMFREGREQSNQRHHEEFQFLKRVNNTLKQQIDGIGDEEGSAANKGDGDEAGKDVFDSYAIDLEQKPPGPWKYARICR